MTTCAYSMEYKVRACVCMCMTCLESDFFKNEKLQIGKKIDGSLVVHSKNFISPDVLVSQKF